MLCPALVGRDVQTEELRRRLDDLADRRGGLVTVVGEPGAGKTRLLDLAASTARDRGFLVLRGRAVASESPVPYRPLSEALVAGFRSTPLPADPTLDGFGQHLGRLVPPWAEGSSGPEPSPHLVGEAIVRLLRVAGATHGGAVLLIEDLHWADAETLAALDHLADTATDEQVLCVASARLDGASADLLDRLRRRDPTARLVADALDAAEVDRMVAACLDVPAPPAGLGEFVRARSDGNPFLVEELLAGLASSGDLTNDGGQWVVSELRATVPASLRDSIGRRLDALDDTARRVVGAAALLGREFDWELLPGIAEVDGRAAADALRAAVAEQLVESDGTAFRFRHALTREAVLAGLLAPERRELATRAWPVVERAHPGLPGPTCELAADLAEAAGDAAAASARLVESARRALSAGALATAESTARRSGRLAAADLERGLDADEVLLDVLAAAGKTTDALAVGADLTERMRVAGAPAGRLLDVHLTTGRAAVVAGDLDAAAREIEQATASAGTVAVDARSGGIAALAAHVALDRGDLDGARRLAEESLAVSPEAAVRCDALLVLGRIERFSDWAQASARFEEAAALAQAAGLGAWHIKARQEMAFDVWTRGDTEALHETRAIAAGYGALATAAVVDLTLADLALTAYDRAGCLSAATACVDASRRYRLATESVAQLWLAGAHALADDDEAMQTAIEGALAADPDDPRILGDLYGRVLATRAVVRDELDSLPGLLDEMERHASRAPAGTSIFPGRIHRAAVLTIADAPGAAEARADVDLIAARFQIPTLVASRAMAQAAELGRRGEAAEASLRFSGAWELAASSPIGLGPAHSLVLLLAPAAHRDGWGEPATWLRAAEAFFAERGYDRTARRCRVLLGEVGAPMPRRGRGDSPVPEGLRALGVTSREVDVLKLAVAGRTNREIADALVLSPKTVERHLSNLFTRLSVASRAELAQVAHPHLGDPAER